MCYVRMTPSKDPKNFENFELGERIADYCINEQQRFSANHNNFRDMNPADRFENRQGEIYSCCATQNDRVDQTKFKQETPVERGIDYGSHINNLELSRLNLYENDTVMMSEEANYSNFPDDNHSANKSTITEASYYNSPTQYHHHHDQLCDPYYNSFPRNDNSLEETSLYPSAHHNLVPHSYSHYGYVENSPQNDLYDDEPLDLTMRRKPSIEEPTTKLDSQESLDETSSPPPECYWLQKIRTGTRSRVRYPKSWEFLVRLLSDPVSNPSFIRWEDQMAGTFRLVKKDEIARIWGTRSSKHQDAALGYDNFARNLRYHYKTKNLEPVSERHLVYKFSDEIMKAHFQISTS